MYSNNFNEGIQKDCGNRKKRFGTQTVFPPFLPMLTSHSKAIFAILSTFNVSFLSQIDLNIFAPLTHYQTTKF